MKHFEGKTKEILGKMDSASTTNEKTRKRRNNKIRQRKNQNHGRKKKNKNEEGVTFSTGEAVLVKACKVSNAIEGTVAKFLALHEGPYIVKKKIALNTYILENATTVQERGQFHVTDLKRHVRREEVWEEQGENESTVS